MTTTSTFTSSSSHHLTSSISSLTASQYQQSPHVARTYKQASQLYLTRRLGEALGLIESLITAPAPAVSDENQERNGFSSISGVDTTTASADGGSETSIATTEAPIATATRAARIKVWSLYISILNEVASMTAEEGKNMLGSVARWKELVKKARDGTIWDEVVEIGYNGNEGAVDADVVANLATLLLSHSANQKLTQQKLESFLSASSTPTLDVASHMSRRKTSPSPGANGTSTPRDLNSRLKILEIYVLHVLPANSEWEYAREFVNMSEVLDDERREAFTQALQTLQDEKAFDARKEEELQKQRKQQLVEEEGRQKEAENESAAAAAAKADENNQLKTESAKENEHDYGVDSTTLNGSPKTTNKKSTSITKPTPASASQSSSAQQSKAPAKRGRSQRPQNLYGRASMLMASIQHSISQIGHDFMRHPSAAFRTLLFVMALLMTLTRRDVRDRLGRASESAWEKIKRTIGMGVKVSYI